MNNLLLVAAACAVISAPAAAAGGAQTAPAPATQPSPPSDTTRVQFYGFIRQDVILDDAPPDSGQSPLFILSEPVGGPSRHAYTMHPRLTRVGVNLTGPALEPLGGATIAGKIEIDFQNGGRDSRAIPR